MHKQKSILALTKRLYSNQRLKERLPTVRLANKQVSRVLRERLDNRATPRVQPSPRTYEPFPFAVTEENKFEVLRRLVEPLIEIPYQEQLASKETYCRNSLRHLSQELYRSGTAVRLDVKRLPCQINPIFRAKKLYEYRNKDEFSIWRGLDGKTPTVGFMVFQIGKHGDTITVEPSECRSMPKETRQLCDILQEFIRHQAKLPVCYTIGEEGGWRRFIIRVNHKGELMLIGLINPVNLRVREVVEERDNFRDFIVSKCKESNLKLTSLYHQLSPTAVDHSKVPYELLYGEPVLQEKVGDYNIVISPGTFVHNSSSGLEAIHEAVRQTISEAFELERLQRKPIIFDINTGAGLLAMSLSKLADKVIAISKSSQSIDDAIINARNNNIENCEFICSELEIALERLLEKHVSREQEAIAILDVPKRGIHKFAIEALRECDRVKKIVYITPKIDAPGTLRNLTALCEKGKSRSMPPFAPVLATPVDIYPHIENCQLVIALERLDP